ncbi:hypothetical protein M413DRAFT_32693 [Hebeloma cylindrosporum]|uniref:Uncharacterized protein n=1 Tax=Hebeloma cylindrosporum TaxID=76867 RepID=A0A0C3BSX6_HEBCY|nr:hypothetical protein M413DRAFT_32693 [Hebeloma cylindrosporum h7]
MTISRQSQVNMRRKKSPSIPVPRARHKRLKDLPEESTTNTIFSKRTRSNNDLHDSESYMGVIGLGQTQVQRGDRKEFKTLDLKRPVRMRQRNGTPSDKHHLRNRHFKQPEVPSKKSPMASGSVGHSRMNSQSSGMANPQSNNLVPDMYTATGLSGGDKWCSPGSSSLPQFSNTTRPLVNCGLRFPPSITVGLGATNLFEGSVATSCSGDNHDDEGVTRPD